MSKTGQARVLTPEQFAQLLRVIQEHRYPEKNTALVQISFSVHDFHQLVQRIETMAKAGADIKPEDFYPEVNKHRGKSRDLPMNDVVLRTAIDNHLVIRLAAHQSVKRTDPLFLTQKGGPILRILSKNTLRSCRDIGQVLSEPAPTVAGGL